MISDWSMLHKYASSTDRYEQLKEYARQNRSHPTLAEQVLWEHIRKKKLGHLFLRQYPISDYIVDFICRDDGLIIEVDGAYHCEPVQAADDATRQRILEDMGYHVLRFTNEEVLFDIDNVLETINTYFKC